MASYLAPNSKEMSVSSSIFVLSCRKSMNSLNASGVRFLRTSTSIKRLMRIKRTSGFSAMTSSNFSQRGSRTEPKAKIYSLLSRTSSNSLLPEFLPGFADFINYLLFRHSFIRGTDFRHKLTDFFQMHFCFFRIGFFHFSHLTDKSIIFVRRCQAFVMPLIYCPIGYRRDGKIDIPNRKLSESIPASEVNGSEKWRNLYSSLNAALSEKKYFSPTPT